MSTPDDGVARGTARRIVWQTTAMFSATLLLLCVIAALFVTKTQEISAERTLRQTIGDADAVKDPPSGVVIYERRGDQVTASPQLHGVPLDQRALEIVSQGGPAQSSDADRGGREYRVRTDHRGPTVVQAGYDLTGQKHERNRLFAGLATAALVGLLVSVFIGRVIAGRAIEPLALAMDRQQRFVADASHELRTPLTQAHTRAQLLHLELQSRSAPAQLVDDADRLVQSTRQLGEIVEEMLMSARLSAEPRQTQPVDMVVLAAAAVDAERERAQERQLAITVDADHGPHIVPGEPTALRRVLNSLLDNAIGHSPASGAVVVTVTRVGAPRPAVRVSVRDHGVGLGSGDPSAVFERFARGEHGVGRRYGLGLALVREVVTAHHGAVTARNAPGGGAEFVVTLPVWPDSRK